MPTIDDIARATGVAKSTVSRVINRGSNSVSAKTREKVLRVVRDMNYHPSALGRSLSNQRSSMIGVVTKRIPGLLSDPYFGEVINGIVDAATDRNLNVALYNGRFWSDDQETETIFRDGRCDGLILLLAAEYPAMTSSLQRQGIPFVTINSGIRSAGINSFDIDNVEAGRRMTRYLIERGHRRIACLHTGIDYFSLERLAGYQEALCEAGIEFDPALVFTGFYWDATDGYARGREIARTLGQNVTALFAATDRLANDAIAGIKDAGLSVPGDISVVGINDTPDARRSNPPLTTLSQSLDRMADAAVTRLCSLIENRDQPERQVLCATRIVERESVKTIE